MTLKGEDHTTEHTPGILVALIIGVAILCFFLAIQMMGTSLGVLGENLSLIGTGVYNPFIGLFIGLLTTAIIQSSSTTTSLTVAAVAAGTFDLEFAIPIILGANVGTTITSTIVAFGYITKSTEFRKAMSAAMIHDMFNILAVFILFPLELRYHFLQNMSTYLAGHMPISISDGYLPFGLKGMFDWTSQGVMRLIGPIGCIIVSVILLFATLKILSNLLYRKLIGERKRQFQQAIFKNRRRSFGWGLLLTAVVQSSSLTSSLIVPIVATNRTPLKRAFYFLMGANIGTTLTAILAGLFRTEEAMSLALAHFLFNSIAVLIFAMAPVLARFPLFLAERLSYLMYRFRITAFAYISITFFLIPFTLIYFSKEPVSKEESAVERREILP
jgi:sodium-dependent phosphate cotransporter